MDPSVIYWVHCLFFNKECYTFYVENVTEKEKIQPLSIGDKISVILYRGGILFFTILVLFAGIFISITYDKYRWENLSIQNEEGFKTFILLIHLFIGISVATIHIYLKKFRNIVKLLYLVSVVSLVSLLLFSKGNIGSFILKNPQGPFFLLPLTFTVGFITMKEAFCFRLYEGYILALFFPCFLFLLSTKVFSPSLTGAILIGIGITMSYFCIRKLKIPFAYDIGDKSAYEK